MFAVSMNAHRSTLGLLAVVLMLLSASLLGADRIGPLTAADASGDLKKSIEDKGYRVTLNDGWSADFWFARALTTGSGGTAGALYPDLANGEFVGVVIFPEGASDFRGQAIAAGTYTLHYQYIPQDANHMGVSPNPDFLLAIPVASDTTPADILPFKRLVALSAKASRTAHPAVFAMAPAGTPGNVAKDDSGMTMFTVEMTAASGKPEKIGIIVKGQATQ